MTTIEAAKIFSDAEKLPPLMRAQVWSEYIGKEIDWVATFFSGEMETPERAFVAMLHEASDKMLFAYVSLVEYPWLQSTLRGKKLRVRGQIAKIDPLRITLEAVSLSEVSEAAH